MAQINPKVEFDRLEGFPDYTGSDFHFLKSGTDLVELNHIAIEDALEELNIEIPERAFYNYIKKAPENLLNYNVADVFVSPVMTADSTTIGDYTYVSSASSVCNENYPAWKAFVPTWSAETDAWQSLDLPTTDAPQWVKLYCGGQDIVPLYFNICNCGSAPRSMKDFKIQGSNDDTVWVDLATDINYDNIANDNFYVYSNTRDQTFKYFRILITSCNDTPHVKIGYWEIVGYVGSPMITLTSNISADNPLIYVDDSGVEHTVSETLSVGVRPKGYKNIVPHMNSTSEQGWTLTSNKMNGYEYAYPQYMTSGINTTGFHCNTAVSTTSLSTASFSSDTPFTPILFKIRNRLDVGSGTNFEVISGFNVRDENGDVIYRTNQHYRTVLNSWYEYYIQNVKQISTFTFEVYQNDNNASFHNYGRGFEILVEDDDGTDFAKWSASYVFFDETSETLVNEYGKFTISQIEPSTPRVNDLWLSVLDKNRVYKYNGTSWTQTSYIPVATVVYYKYNVSTVYNYPKCSNWYDWTTNSKWISPELPVSTNQYILYPHNRQIQNIKMKNYDCILINKIAELGYETGDIAQCVSSDFSATDNIGLTPFIDDTFIGVKIGSLNSGISVLNKNTATESYITPANWVLRLRIW